MASGCLPGRIPLEGPPAERPWKKPCGKHGMMATWHTDMKKTVKQTSGKTTAMMGEDKW